MGTTLTYAGVDSVLELDDQAITLHGSGDPEDGRVVIPRWEVEGVTLKPASLLGYGRLTIVVSGGGEHTIEFARGDEDRFTDLAAIIS